VSFSFLCQKIDDLKKLFVLFVRYLPFPFAGEGKDEGLGLFTLTSILSRQGRGSYGSSRNGSRYRQRFLLQTSCLVISRSEARRNLSSAIIPDL
jgi:hypothetical protein